MKSERCFYKAKKKVLIENGGQGANKYYFSPDFLNKLLFLSSLSNVNINNIYNMNMHNVK